MKRTNALLLCAAAAVLLMGEPQLALAEDVGPKRHSQVARPKPAPLWASICVGLGLGAAALPLSPVYSAIALGACQAPQSRVFMSRVGQGVRKTLGGKGREAGSDDVSVKTFARALNSRLGNIVSDLDGVPVFLVVDPSGKPLKINVGEGEGSNLTFAYLEFTDAEGLAKGLRTPTGEPVSDISVVGTTLGAVVRDYLAKREANSTDEMLIMPSSMESRTAQELMTKLGTEAQMVPNSVPIYQVEGLPAKEGEKKGADGKATALSFFRFTDMQVRVEAFRKDVAAAAGPEDEKPKLRVRMMRLHEVAALTGTERLPYRPQFIPSSAAVVDIAKMRDAKAMGTLAAKASTGSGSKTPEPAS